MNKNFLYTLLDSMSVSGHEIPLQKKVIAEMTPHCDEIRTDYTGNVISILNPNAPFKVISLDASGFLKSLWSFLSSGALPF